MQLENRLKLRECQLCIHLAISFLRGNILSEMTDGVADMRCQPARLRRRKKSGMSDGYSQHQQ